MIIWGSSIEYTLGAVRCFFIMMLSAFPANLTALYFVEYLDEVISGSDGAIFGLLGSTMGYVILNW